MSDSNHEPVSVSIQKSNREHVHLLVKPISHSTEPHETMSIIALAKDVNSSVTPAVLQDVAAKNNIQIRSKQDEDAYLIVLQSADATMASIVGLPDYIDPRLSLVPTQSPREWWKVKQNSHNAWSHASNFRAASPTNSLLEGRKIVIKDNMSVGGLPYTCGMLPEMAGKDGKYVVSEIDSTVVRRLLEAGVILAGTSTCENYSMTPLSYTSANGPVDNPWLRGYSTGGSSSGSACLLSLGLARKAGVPGLEAAGDDIEIAMGGDQAGSIRIPASFCGFYGLKPTYGLVPYTGIAGLSPMIDHAGPMARTIEDIATILTVLAGYDGLDPRMTPESPLRENVKQYHEELAAFTSSPSDSKPLKVGIISDSLTSLGTSSEVARIVRDAAMKHFTAAGAEVAEISLPEHIIAPAIWAAACRPYMTDLTIKGRVPDVLSHSLPHFVPQWPPNQAMYDALTHINPAVINVLFGSTFMNEKYGPEVQAKAHRLIFGLRAAYDKALSEFDVLITPTSGDVAPKLPDMRPESEGGSTLMDKMKVAVGVTNNTCPFNATGHPAMSVPCGWATPKEGKGHLPVGMQIIGKRWDDSTVIRAAKTFELGGGGLGEWPGLA